MSRKISDHRTQFVRRTAIVTSIATGLAIATRAAVGEMRLAVIAVGLAGAIGLAAVGIMAGRQISSRRAGIQLVTLFLLLAGFATVCGGGASSPASVTLAACPLLAALAVSRKAGIVVTVLVLSFIGLLGLDAVPHLTPIITEAHEGKARSLLLFVTISLVASVAWTYERENADIFARLEELAVTDPLTRLPNRRAFQERLELSCAQARRSGAPISLIILDVDHFKSYNDLYGHTAGDLCLQTVAEVLGNGVRRTADLAARIGGEEFAVILGATSAEGAEQVARQLKASLEDRHLEHAESRTGLVTFSAGIASTTELDPSQLVDVADLCLYEAKAVGRNRCVSFRPEHVVLARGRSCESTHHSQAARWPNRSRRLELVPELREHDVAPAAAVGG